jgi:hypothetical protein
MLSVSLSALEDGCEWASASGFDTSAFLCLETGKVIHAGRDDPMPVEIPEEELEDPEKYVPVPEKNHLIDARDLLFDFITEHLPDELETVRGFFYRRGAWGNTKDLLWRKGRLNEWQVRENKAVVDALREWAEENGFVLSP